MHDPTQVDRQGPDVGDQYRSVIFTQTPSSWIAAEARKARAQARFDGRSRPRSSPSTTFYPAEDYHQRYYDLNGHTPYCHVFPVDVVASSSASREERLAAEPHDLVRAVAQGLGTATCHSDRRRRGHTP